MSFAQDEDGNWGYKVGGADSVIPFKSGLKGELLWENPSPTSDFGATTLSLPMQDYDYFAIEAVFSKTEQVSNCQPTLMPKSLINDGAKGTNYFTTFKIHATEQVGGYSTATRDVWVDYDSITFNSYGSFHTEATKYSNGAKYCIPTKIYGFKNVELNLPS